MSQLLIHNASLVLEGGVAPGAVVVRNGLIAQVFTGERGPVDFPDADTLDLRGAYLAPGFIDIHIHGSAGVDVAAAGRDELKALSRFLLNHGVTGYFPTLPPSSDDTYTDAVAAITSYIGDQDAVPDDRRERTARILGIHFEGPLLNVRKCGALPPEFLRPADRFPRLAAAGRGPAGNGVPILVTLAPEADGAMDLARSLAASGVRVFVGHSEADPETLDRAAQAGVRHVTHFPNALNHLHSRRPGVVGWALVRDDVTIDCIADFHHIDPLALRLFFKVKSPRRVALISDAIWPAGLGDGVFEVWGRNVAVRGGKTFLELDGGTSVLAGSVITIRDAIRNVMSLEVPIEDAVRMASLIPARIVGLENQVGSLRPGKRADLVALRREDFSIEIAVVGGRVSLDNR